MASMIASIRILLQSVLVDTGMVYAQITVRVGIETSREMMTLWENYAITENTLLLNV